jgi:hypothetical protein
MRALGHALPAEPTGTDGTDRGVNLWADSVGEAAKQLGVLLVIAIAAHFVTGLVLRP